MKSAEPHYSQTEGSRNSGSGQGRVFELACSHPPARGTRTDARCVAARERGCWVVGECVHALMCPQGHVAQERCQQHFLQECC